jgi:hypothetical protein
VQVAVPTSTPSPSSNNSSDDTFWTVTIIIVICAAGGGVVIAAVLGVYFLRKPPVATGSTAAPAKGDVNLDLEELPPVEPPQPGLEAFVETSHATTDLPPDQLLKSDLAGRGKTCC